MRACAQPSAAAFFLQQAHVQQAVWHLPLLAWLCRYAHGRPVRPLSTDTNLHVLLPRICSGPLVVGLTLSAIAVGAAFSAGAIAFTTFILPMVILMSIGGLASFGLFAGLGAMFVLPKLLFSALSLVSCSCCTAVELLMFSDDA
jgi:hypothetical protein